jgi:hypothetical protein
VQHCGFVRVGDLCARDARRPVIVARDKITPCVRGSRVRVNSAHYFCVRKWTKSQGGAAPRGGLRLILILPLNQPRSFSSLPLFSLSSLFPPRDACPDPSLLSAFYPCPLCPIPSSPLSEHMRSLLKKLRMSCRAEGCLTYWGVRALTDPLHVNPLVAQTFYPCSATYFSKYHISCDLAVLLPFQSVKLQVSRVMSTGSR